VRNRPRAGGALILAASAALLTGAAEPGGTLRLDVTGLRSANGMVLVCLTREAARFPDCSGSSTARTAKVPADSPHVSFEGLQPGRYAISVLHDENANGRADKSFGLIPREGFGFSRDAPVRMGPPKFEQAAFSLGEQAMTQSIKMRYLM
jgi:uncharacterized protein (DUF2141 family)